MTRESPRTTIRCGDLELDLATRILRRRGWSSEVRLPLSNLKFLELLMRRCGRVVSHDAIIEALWPGDSDGGPLYAKSIVRIQVNFAREKLQQLGLPRSCLKAAYGEGYMLEIDGAQALTCLALKDAEIAALRSLVAQSPPHLRDTAEIVRRILP